MSTEDEIRLAVRDAYCSGYERGHHDGWASALAVGRPAEQFGEQDNVRVGREVDRRGVA